jgi:hypothetical protein
MDIDNPLFSDILNANILQEIEILPKEFKEKSEQVRVLQIELNELNLTYSQKENQINKITKEIISIENILTSNLEEMSKIKSEQTQIMNLLNEESFQTFRKNFYSIPNNYQDIILIFLKYEGYLKEELNFLLIKQEIFLDLLRDSYSYYKSIEEIDKEKYETCRNKIKNIINEENKKNFINIKGNKKDKDKNKLMPPFDIIVNFISNTFKIIDINKSNEEKYQKLKEKNKDKQNLFIQNKILEETIKEKQEKKKSINNYIKHINNIIIKYKNFFANSNKINIINNNNSLTNKRYDENNISDSENLNNNIINNNINNNNKILNNNTIDNEKRNKEYFINDDKILKSNNNNKEDIMKKNSLKFVENKNNNFYHDVNLCKNKDNKNNKEINISDNPNNIKIISINAGKNKDLLNINNPNNANPKNKITNSISFDNYYVNQNKNRNKTTIPNIKDISAYKSKIIKTNSLEQGDASKISVNISTINDEQNKSYITMSGYYFNKKNTRSVIKPNKPLFFSYELNEDKKTDNNINISSIQTINNKTEIEIKNLKQEGIRRNIIDNYNNNIIVDSGQMRNDEKKRKKNFYLSPVIYNNNRKILKMIEMNKNSEKTKKFNINNKILKIFINERLKEKLIMMINEKDI